MLPGSTSATLEKFCLAHQRVRQLKLDIYSNLSSEEGPQLEVVFQESEVIVTTYNYADADTQSAFAEEVIGMGTGPIVKGLKRHSKHRDRGKPRAYTPQRTEANRVQDKYNHSHVYFVIITSYVVTAPPLPVLRDTHTFC